MQNLIRLARIKWTNRHFAREINAQLAQYRQYARLLETAADPDDREFYAYEMAYYKERLAKRANLDPTKTKRFRVR